MIASTKDFWIFHAIYWAVTGLLLFLYGLTYGHWEVALVRNLYNPLVGFGCSYLMQALYVHKYPATFHTRLLMVLLLSLAGALVSALLVNPVTYALLGYEVQHLALSNLLKDGLYFVLFYLVWSLLYLQLSGKPLAEPTTSVAPAMPGSLETITVTKGERKLNLDPLKICYIQASGDYVEFHTRQEQYLKQGTISYYEQALSDGLFVRIHRSIIVNQAQIKSISGPVKGQYWINLGEGREVRSSRNYQSVVANLIPEAD